MFDTIILDGHWFELWQNGDWFQAVFQPLIWRLGRGGIILLLGAPLTLALWQQTESLTVPAVLLTLFMSLMLGGAPAGATVVGYVIVVVATLLAFRSIIDGGVS